MEKIGRYTILGELGRGGFGIVYKAQDPKINRVVAIKTIPTQELRGFAGGELLYERLSREAQSAGALTHPGIVTVYELAEDEAVTYIVMEFVPGKALRDLMGADAGLTVEKKLSLLRQMAEGLDYAHANGVIHRDVKPANILVTDSGVAKIADFGVAKMVHQNTMAATGTTVGTPSYMSPEQILAKTLDGRSDQFSLAVIAYELLTGKQPFTSDSLPALIHQILSVEPPDPAVVNKEVAPPGSTVLLKALAKQPENRFATCVDFIDALRAAVVDKVAMAPVKKPAGSSNVVKAGLAVGLGIAIAGFYLTRHFGQPAPEPVAAPVSTTPEPVVAAAPVQKAPEPVVPKVEAKKKEPAIPVPVVVAETKPAESPDPGPDAANASYHGPPEGRFSWSGALQGGERLVIVRNRVRKGTVSGAGLPPGIALQVEASPADIKVLQQPSAENGFRLVLANAASGSVGNISILWKEVQR